jgi:hypothetical protein
MSDPIVDHDAEREASGFAHHNVDDAQSGAAQPSAYDALLKCRALIDESLKPKDWIRLFRRLLDDDTTLSAALLLKYRFGLPAQHVGMKQPAAEPNSYYGSEGENDLESAPRTADEVPPQQGR